MVLCLCRCFLQPIRCMTVWVCVDPELHANVPVVATGGSSGSVCLWNVFSGKMLHLLRDHDDAIQALCAAPMHPALSNNNTVHVYMCMCVFVFVVLKHTCACVCMYVCVFVGVRVGVYMCTCMCVFIFVYLYMFVCVFL